MYGMSFAKTDNGIAGVMPDGEVLAFDNEDEYRQTYKEREDQLYDEMAEAFHWNEDIDDPYDDWLQYA